MKIQLLIIVIIFNSQLLSSDFNITRLKYQGGGDWYADKSSIPNLLQFIRNETDIKVGEKEIKVSIGEKEFYDNQYYYITGHGNISFNDKERDELREALTSGAFLHADDNYGMDKSFREEMKTIFPDKDWVALGPEHEIFNIFYKFPNGLPKIHEHDGKSPQALALFEGERIILLYTYESDLGDGWENASVHQDPWPIRESALKMGVNIIYFALTQ